MKASRLIAAVAVAAAWTGIARSVAAPSDAPPGASACSGCHAAKAGVDTAVPRLAGRAAAEIVVQMQAFKAGKRPATVMDRIAKGLTDAEIEAIAAWYAQQK
jgi:cytochrome c553